MVERVGVPFAGDGGGVGPLSWGQQSIWKEMATSGSSLAMSAVRALEPGATLDRFVDEYSFYLSRYQSMRTLLRFAPDGSVSQVVVDSGTAEIEVYDSGDRDPAAVAAEVSAQHYAVPFDYEREWPMRMALVRQAGALTHLVVTLSHHVADPTAAMAMFEDLSNRDASTGEPPRPPGLQPLEQARLQLTPSALRQNEAALRYWETQLLTLPPPRLPVPDDAAPPEDRYWELDFLSPALYRALRAVAARLGVTTTPVLYAAFAHALGQATGTTRVATMITVNNRFRPGLADAAGHMSQHGLCTLDLAEGGFDDLVLRARRRLLTAHKNAYYAQGDVDGLIARIGRERGVSFDLLCLFNNRRSEDGPIKTAPAAADVRAAGATTFDWRRLPSLHQRLMVHVNDAVDALSVRAQADTTAISRGDLTVLLRRMEATVVDAALA
ncbi:condensation domain-containing protein [Dactylosporangium sp. NPDC049140]|uniref:condensation domain-containing protein n=1 Tax=Dactylosporangium sp. NPDC049140 TaxID=3155647 RepID=UPI0033DBAEE9